MNKHKIQKSKEEMTSKQRVLKTFRFEKTDRVPINYSANPEIHRKLKEALDCGTGDDSEDILLDKLGVDFRPIGADYIGTSKYSEIEGYSVEPVFGYYTKWIENSFGGYSEIGHFPLKGADSETIRNYNRCTPDDFDYSKVKQKCERYKDYACYVGNPGLFDIINTTGFVMGMEDALMNLIDEDEATIEYINKRIQIQYEITEKTIIAAEGGVDFLWMGEDLGTQMAPMISLDLYRKILKPIHQKGINLAKKYNLPVMIHTCGSSSWVYEDFIEMGINCIETLQPEAKNMSPEYLKNHFKGRLSFAGGISTAGPLAYGTEEETVQDVKEKLEIFMKDYGYIFAPTHMIQDNTPVENVIAMYNAGHKYGVY